MSPAAVPQLVLSTFPGQAHLASFEQVDLGQNKGLHDTPDPISGRSGTQLAGENQQMEAAERRMRETIPLYVGSFNQPSYLRHMIETLSRNGFGSIIIADNASSSPKTLAYLADCEGRPGLRVWRIGQNIGPGRTLARIRAAEKGPFIFTDPDLELSDDLPADFLGQLFDISRRYRCRKIGLALEIPAPEEMRDLRFRSPYLGTFTVRDWEQHFWEHELEPSIYRADVDTTFHLWNPEIRLEPRYIYWCLRAAIRPRRIARILPYTPFSIRVARRGFIARHLPWYKDDRFPDDEREFYLRTISRASTWLRG